jgi:predicted HicB family RNase H-like nuclease
MTKKGGFGVIATEYLTGAQEARQKIEAMAGADLDVPLQDKTTPEVQEKGLESRYKPDATGAEVKSKRVNLLLQPSLYAQMQQEAKALNISVNELVHKVFNARYSR